MDAVIELCVCCKCGITNESEKHWGPVCKLTGHRVCMDCCRSCEYHRAWSGIWQCVAKTPEERRAAASKKTAALVQREIQKTSNIYHKRRKEKAKLQAIKDAKARAKWRRENERNDRNMSVLRTDKTSIRL